MKRVLALAAIVGFVGVAGAAPAQTLSCGVTRPEAGGLRFADGSVAFRGGLAVNPDGTTASYTVGNRGYTYVQNGVNLWRNGRSLGCTEERSSMCDAEWRRAEAMGFGPGSSEFCVFAMEVMPYPGRTSKVACGSGGRFLIGNGKGMPRKGLSVLNATGGSTETYVSTTAVNIRIDGAVRAIDSALVPAVVTARSRPDLKGRLAFVVYGDRTLFAVVGDLGPEKWGEGSIALHQLLQHGALRPLPPVGPIPVSERCGPVERSLEAPFLSRPDGGPADQCRAGRRAATASDIRAYGGIGSGVSMLIMSDVSLLDARGVIDGELTQDRMRAAAEAAGYDENRMRGRLACLR